MGDLILTAEDLGIPKEEVHPTIWSLAEFSGIKNRLHFTIGAHTVVSWDTGLNSGWEPNFVELAAISWFVRMQPATSMFVIRWLTGLSGEYTFNASYAQGQQERADRIVHVWKILADKYRGYKEDGK